MTKGPRKSDNSRRRRELQKEGTSAKEKHENCESHMRLKLSLVIVEPIFASTVRIGCVYDGFSVLRRQC